ncbi:hypothetical protein AB0A05_07685 [Streptomyces sp. NPDC046374]|uniref:hypothetical protein n=1 Tax=Streptomyces sp. NPDC046374 TaxID=3154917 RepID=UPI0033CA988C
MIASVLAAALAVLAAAVLLALVLRPVPRRPSGPTAGFRVGPLWSWCPEEKHLTPHQVDAGARRCLSCKTSTPHDEGV